MNEQLKIRKMSGIAILLALSFVFGFIGNYVQIGPININLSLLPIAIAAIIYGPFEGALLGLASGLIVLLSPSTSLFYSFNVFFTILVVLVKTSLAGIISGLIFKVLRKKNYIFAAILASIIIPIINTGVFTLGCYLFFYNNIFTGVTGNTFFYFISTWIGVNFLFEILSIIILSPIIASILKTISKNYNIGANI